jgi:hypothetical protein
MLIFLVVTRFINGHLEERAFASLHAAREYAILQDAEGDTEILDMPVVGEMDEPNIAYTIRWYDLNPDTGNVEAIYGSYRLAKAAAGNLGHVRALRIEVSTDLVEEEPYETDDAGEVWRALSTLRGNRSRRQRAALYRLG